MFVRWPGQLEPTAGSDRNSSMLARGSPAAASRQTSSIWCLCRCFGLPDVAEYWESVVTLNTWQQHLIAQIVVQNLFGTVTCKRLAVLGFAFKADTNDAREVPAIRICRDLL